MRRLMSLDMLIALLVGVIALVVVFTGSIADAVGGLALLVVTGAFLSSYRPDPRIGRIERLLERIAEAVAPEVEAAEPAERPNGDRPVDAQKPDVLRTAEGLPASLQPPLRDDDDGLAREHVAAPDHDGP